MDAISTPLLIICMLFTRNRKLIFGFNLLVDHVITNLLMFYHNHQKNKNAGREVLSHLWIQKQKVNRQLALHFGNIVSHYNKQMNLNQRVAPSLCLAFINCCSESDE